MTDEDPVKNLTEDECWEMLRAHEFGRLAFHLTDQVHLVPINYAVDDEAGTLLFRTEEGSKLLAVVNEPRRRVRDRPIRRPHG